MKRTYVIRGKILTKEDWVTIARDYSSKGPTKLSEELKVSKQRISQVGGALRKGGVVVPKLRTGKNYKTEYIDFVKKTLKI